LTNELVDVLLAVTEVAALHIVLEFPGAPAASGIGEFERPQEVGRLLEVGASSENLVDKIFYREDVELLEASFDDSIVGEGDALFVDLAVPTLVNKFANGLQVGLAMGQIRNKWLHDKCTGWNIPVGDIGLDQTKHLLSRPGSLDKDTIVDLQQTKELQNLAGLRRNFIDTFNRLVNAGNGKQ
jgi:hypothetical protein